MTDVERIYGELKSARATIEAADSISDRVAFESLAVKTLILSAASYFEREICQTILRTANKCGVPAPLKFFIEKQGLERKYHSLFNWDSNNANKLFSLFGKPARDKLVDGSKALEQALECFLFVNRARNDLVHENFAGATIDLTFEEAWAKYERALTFVDWFSDQLDAICGDPPE